MGKFREQFEELVKKFMHGKEQEDFLAFIDTFDRRNDLYRALQSDVTSANHMLRENSQDQYLRRTFVRTTFAMIEGLLNVLTDEVLETHRSGFIELSKDEIEKLTERAVTGKGETRPRFLPLGAKVQFSFLIFARKIGGLDYSLDTTTKEWETFESAIEVRNQLMHPRGMDDLTVNDMQISIVLDASNWFLDQHGKLNRQVGEVVSQRSLENLLKGRKKGIQSGK